VEGSFVVGAVLKDIRQPADAVEVVVLESLELYLAFSRGTSGR
jgi:polar amino acid transport system substrate-binding protein